MSANLRPCFQTSDKACSFLLSLGKVQMSWDGTCELAWLEPGNWDTWQWQVCNFATEQLCPRQLGTAGNCHVLIAPICQFQAAFAGPEDQFKRTEVPLQTGDSLDGRRLYFFPTWSSCRLARDRCAQQRFSSFEAWEVTATWSSGASICGTLRCRLRKSSPICICWRCLYCARSFACSWLTWKTQTACAWTKFETKDMKKMHINPVPLLKDAGRLTCVF